MSVSVSLSLCLRLFLYVSVSFCISLCLSVCLSELEFHPFPDFSKHPLFLWLKLELYV